MTSMAPTSGGWMSTLGWLASVSSSVFVITSLIEAVVDVANEDFLFQPWQYTLIMLAFLLITIAFNTWGAKALPKLEVLSLFGHMGGFLVVIVPLLVMAPKNPAREVFTEVVNSSGWGSTGTSCLIAQVTIMYCNLAEEVENASLAVPRAMWWSYVLNVTMGISILIVMLFCIGPLESVLDAQSPYLALFKNTGSNAMAFSLLIILFILISLGNITALATTSREMWAFSRDKGFPFSRWISRMDNERQVPDNSVYLTSIIAGILCLVNLGSTFAFNIIVSLTLLALLSTYMISIGCVLRKRLLDEPLPPARWSLGRFGIPINAFAFVYCGFVMIFACFPAELPVDTGSANWAPVVWVAALLLSGVVYGLHGREHYTPPVVFVEGKRPEGIELQGVE
ncbi:hypothetical protein PZA11_002305 [Diplocarpon coronariae]